MLLDEIAERTRTRRRIRLVFGLTTVLLGVLEVVLIATPALKRLADEYRLQLPSLTKNLFQLPRIAPAVVLGWWVFLAMNAQAKWSPRTASVISRVSVVLAFVLAGASVMALALPLLSLICTFRDFLYVRSHA